MSTDDQARDGVSLSAQEAKIEAYCLVKDWTFTEMIRDPGQSTKSLNRHGPQWLLPTVQAHQVEAIIVHKLDRLKRH